MRDIVFIYRVNNVNEIKIYTCYHSNNYNTAINKFNNFIRSTFGECDLCVECVSFDSLESR